MKFKGKKHNSSEPDPAVQVAPEPTDSFYSRGGGEESLYEGSAGGARKMRRSSSQSPAHRRQTTNRTPNLHLLLVLLKVVLIPALLFGAYLGLKALVGKISEPSDEQLEQWEEEVVRMDPQVGVSAPVLGDEVVVDQAFLAGRTEQWEQADRHLRAGIALEKRQIDDEATVRLEKALSFAPQNRPARLLLLDVYMRLEKYEEAIPLCIQLLDQDSDDWIVKMDLLRALQGSEALEACLFLAGQMLEQEPTRLDIMEIAAYAHAALGSVDEALEIYMQILQRDEEHLLALAGASAIHQWQAEWEKALPYYMELLRLNPSEEYYLALARCYSQLKESGKAAIFLGQAASLYGEKTVGAWLADPGFDPVRETVDFRSMSDRIVGVEARKAIESIRRREVQQQVPEALPGTLDLPRPDLQMLRPNQQ